jgi:hypothetical protein
MQFVQEAGGVWLLIDETAPPDACVLARVSGPVEVLPLRGLCESRLASGGPLTPFEFTIGERTYRVTPYPDRDGRLSLRIDGSDGSLSRVETEFRHTSD